MGELFGRSGRLAAAVAVGVCAALAARAASAHQATVEVPSHLVAGNQMFEATPTGLQAYLATIKTTNPDVFAQLAPDADRLATRATVARVLLIGGLAAGVVTAVYGFAARNNCPQPQLGDPNFAADSAAWGNCNESNFNRSAAFGAAGAGLMLAGIVGWAVAIPSRADLLDLVNRNNRVSPRPLQLQLGYNPVDRLTQVGALLSF